MHVCQDCAVHIRQLTSSLSNNLVEIFSTTSWFTQTRHFDFLDWEFIVVRQFFTTAYVSQSKNDNVHTAVYDDLSRVAVWLTRVINEPCNVATLRRIYNVVVAATEHVAADALCIVSPFSHVGHRRADHLTSVLHQHLASTDVAETKQSKAVNCRPMHCHCLTAELSQVTIPHRYWQIAQFHSSEKQTNLAISSHHKVIQHTHTKPFYGHFSGTTRVSRCHHVSLRRHRSIERNSSFSHLASMEFSEGTDFDVEQNFVEMGDIVIGWWSSTVWERILWYL